MKTIRVVAAVIKAVKEDGRTMIFATQRGYGEFKGGWEFPGGKIEAGETPQEALKREIMEELDTEVSVGKWIETVEYDYPGFHLSMDCFWCEIVKGDLVLKEHEAARWLTREELTDVEWLPADVAVAEKIDQSVSHNGVCLTVVSIQDGTYTVTAMKETIERLDLVNIGNHHMLVSIRNNRYLERIRRRIADCQADTVHRDRTFVYLLMYLHFLPYH